MRVMANLRSFFPAGNRRGFTLIELLVVLAVLALLVALLLPARRSSRGAARRLQCKNNLKQIGLALHNYQDKYGAFPPAFTTNDAGERLHSWRTLILPFLEQQPLYDSIDLSKPWNDPANAFAYEKVLHVYRCPSGEFPETHTTYLGIVGERCALHPGRPRALDEFTDGSSSTALVGEVSAGRCVHWMAPIDLDEDFLTLLDAKSAPHAPGMHILFADGSVRWESEETFPANRRAWATIAGGEPLSE